MKQYGKQYYQDHKEERRQYDKQRNSMPARKIYDRVKKYNKYHQDRIIITPMEAKDMYELTGYIPDFLDGGGTTTHLQRDMLSEGLFLKKQVIL